MTSHTQTESTPTETQPLETQPLETATFKTVPEAQNALMRLFRAGIHREQISVASPHGTTIDFPEVEELRDPGAPAAEHAAVGTAVGAALGGAAGSVAAVVGSVAGLVLLGPLFAGVVAGSVAGGLVGAMVGRGVASDLADYYDQAVRQGRLLVAVEPRTTEEVPAIRAAFREAGAEPVQLS